MAFLFFRKKGQSLQVDESDDSRQALELLQEAHFVDVALGRHLVHRVETHHFQGEHVRHGSVQHLRS